MGVRILGVDTPLDSQAEVPFQGDVDIPGQYGPGGFYKPNGVPSLVAPTSGPAPGTSLSAPSDWRNPFTSPRIDPTTGQPEMLTGQGGIVDRTAPKNPMSWLTMGANLFGNKAKLAALAAAEATRATPTANDAAPTNMWNQRPSGVGGMPGPQVVNPPTPYRPEDSPSFTAPTPASYPHMPWPDTGATPAAAPAARGGPRATPAAAGPAAAAQQPNLGNYGATPFTTFDRPNMSPQNSARDRQGAPQMGMLDLSRLFGGGQPVVNPDAPAAAAQPVSSPVAPGGGMSKAPGFMGPLQKGAVWPKEMGPKKRPKDSASSQGG